MTIRLDDDQAQDLATVAAVDGKPAVDVIRAAIADHVSRRKADPAFRSALRDHISRAARLLGDDPGAGAAS